MFTEELRKISEEYTAKSNKVIVDFIPTEYKESKIDLSASSKKDFSYFKEHPFRAIVMSIGSGVAEIEKDLKRGSMVYLRGIPSVNDFLVINEKVYYCVSNDFILCYKNQ